MCDKDLKCAVAISTYNGEEYIDEQLQSLVAQTRKPDCIYVCDDCSSDSTFQIVQDYANRNSSIQWKAICNEYNKGWQKNFHDLILGVEEDVIFLCDQDDIWSPHKIEKMLIELEINPSIELLVSGYEPLYMDEDSKISNSYLNYGKHFRQIQKIPLNYQFMNVMRPGCTFAVRKTFCDLIAPYWDDTLPHDAVLWRYALLRGTAYYLNEPLICWRRYKKSSSSKYYKAENNLDPWEIRYNQICSSTKSRILFLETAKKFAKNKKIEKEESQLIEQQYIFEKEYKQNVEEKNMRKLLLTGIRYRKFYLSVKSIFADACTLQKVSKRKN